MYLRAPMTSPNKSAIGGVCVREVEERFGCMLAMRSLALGILLCDAMLCVYTCITVFFSLRILVLCTRE